MPIPAVDNNMVKITFINVGYGESTLITYTQDGDATQGYTILIDGGSNESAEYQGDAYRMRAADYLQQASVSQIDLLINTHIHEDHTCGLLPVLQSVPVRAFWGALLPDASWSPLPEKLATSASTLKFLHAINDSRQVCTDLRKKGIPTQQVDSSFQKQTFCPGFFAELLGPDPAHVSAFHQRLHQLHITALCFSARQALLAELDASMNNISVILRLNANGRRILLVGDTNLNGYETLMRQPEQLKADIFKLGHHGQRDSISEAILAAVDPEVAIICASSDRRYESMHPDILALLQSYGEKRGRPVCTLLTDMPDLPPYTTGKQKHHAVSITIDEAGTLSNIE